MATKPNYDKVQTSDCYASYTPGSFSWTNTVLILISTAPHIRQILKNLDRSAHGSTTLKSQFSFPISQPYR